jgi:hypothetical protein
MADYRKVENGIYAPMNHWGGYVQGWLYIANVSSNPDEWIVLGTVCDEEKSYADCTSSEDADGEAKWDNFLLDEVVRLAEEKGLVPEETCLYVFKSNSCLELEGAKSEWRNKNGKC